MSSLLIKLSPMGSMIECPEIDAFLDPRGNSPVVSVTFEWHVKNLRERSGCRKWSLLVLRLVTSRQAAYI